MSLVITFPNLSYSILKLFSLSITVLINIYGKNIKTQGKSLIFITQRGILIMLPGIENIW